MELSPFCKHTIAEIQFCSFYFFKTSGIFATSPEINVSQHILSICVGKINPFEFRIFFIFFFYVFRVFLEIMKNGVMYLVALIPSIGEALRTEGKIRAFV